MSDSKLNTQTINSTLHEVAQDVKQLANEQEIAVNNLKDIADILQKEVEGTQDSG